MKKADEEKEQTIKNFDANLINQMVDEVVDNLENKTNSKYET